MYEAKEFFELLEKHRDKFKWFLTFYGAIRGSEHSDNYSFCPVTAVHFAETGEVLFNTRAEKSPFNCPGIIGAADDQALLGYRRRLLDTLFPDGVK